MEETALWTLTFVDGGRAVLTTKEPLEREAYEHVQELWARFVQSKDQVMIIGSCEVRRVGRVELEIGTDAIIVREHIPSG